MMAKDKLRKADIFSGTAIFILGLWIISQGLQMPMKDSWGGVQNVWFVSPALFPLFVGAMISLLGALLVRTAAKTVGFTALGQVLAWLGSRELVLFLKTASSYRFYAMAILFFSFVYLNVPRVDFFLCAVLFLTAFITMFYIDDDKLLKLMLGFYVVGTIMFILFSALALGEVAAFPNDWFTLIFIMAYCGYVKFLIRGRTDLRKKYRLSLILGIAAPFIIGPIFKYLLLVPMPTEGLVVTLLDAVWYWDFS